MKTYETTRKYITVRLFKGLRDFRFNQLINLSTARIHFNGQQKNRSSSRAAGKNSERKQWTGCAGDLEERPEYKDGREKRLLIKKSQIKQVKVTKKVNCQNGGGNLNDDFSEIHGFRYHFTNSTDQLPNSFKSTAFKPSCKLWLFTCFKLLIRTNLTQTILCGK